MNEELKSNLLSKKHWSRLVFMLLVSVVLYIAFFITWFVIVAQFTFALATGKDNDNLRRLGESLALFIRQCVSFLTYSDDMKPFPFNDWPQAEDVHTAETDTTDERMGEEMQAVQATQEAQIDTHVDHGEEQTQEGAFDVTEMIEAPSAVPTDNDDLNKKDV